MRALRNTAIDKKPFRGRDRVHEILNLSRYNGCHAVNVPLAVQVMTVLPPVVVTLPPVWFQPMI